MEDAVKYFSDIAKENFKKWNDALQTGNPDAIADLYDEKASFLPTLSPKFVLERSGVVEYFTHFMAKKPIGSIVEESVLPLSDDSYQHAGLYNFEMDTPDSTGRTFVSARFTYVWKKSGDAWKIVHHHSSLLPESH